MKNIREKLYNNTNTCSSFFNDSTDTHDTAQLFIIIRMVCKDNTFKEERTRVVDIFNAFKNFFTNLDGPLFLIRFNNNRWRTCNDRSHKSIHNTMSK